MEDEAAFLLPRQHPTKSNDALVVFPLPVDSHHKSTVFRPLSAAQPHMAAFHLAWLSLFSCFFSTFSIPPLLPIIRQHLSLSDADVAYAGSASFVGAIFSRLLMGPACDLFGPRVASATLSLVTAPLLLSGAAFVSSAVGFALLRFLVGFSLANFVSSQFWMSSMFSPCVVGRANAVAAGWAVVGSGFAQLIMPFVYTLITACHVPSSAAWRLAFLLPAAFQAATAVMIIKYGQDGPDGNHGCGRTGKAEEGGGGLSILVDGLTNYRGWILALTYGYCFGAELTTDNIIAGYFYDRFEIGMEAAGAIAGTFGVANCFTRPMGGWLSDEMGRRFGMRGRLWALWAVQTTAGVLCILLGRVGWSLWASLGVMFGFSVFIQAASGLTFGVVPFVSERSLGVISGMTGSGGTVGSVVTQLLFFPGSSRFSKQAGISLMGVMIIACTLPVALIYFPRWGGMFCGPSSGPADDDDHDGDQHPSS